MNRYRFTLPALGFLCFISVILAQSPAKFRTDKDGPYTPAELKQLKGKMRESVLQWYTLEDGKFPPADSAHAISGELIQVNHTERLFQLRVDRNDSQDRSVWDLPLEATMLPYGTITYHGAPAALQDIPLGTHLHGLFYLRDANDKTPPPDTQNQRITPEIDFRRCFALEDDFSRSVRLKKVWKVVSVDLETMKLVAQAQTGGQDEAKPVTFDLQPSTQVYLGKRFATMQEIQPNQEIVFNLTWATLYGPGRITELWLNETARKIFTEKQLAKHHQHIRERGIPGWVSSVDDEKQIITVTMFGGLDTKLISEFGDLKAPTPPGSVGVAVSRDSLMTYDPVNDRKRGSILDLKQIPTEPGSSGWQIKLKMDLLLEGYRPKRVVRLYPAAWKVIALPREEQFFGRE